MNPYEELDKAFLKLKGKRSDILFDICDITTAKQIGELKEILDTHGVVILKNAVSGQGIKNIYQNISDCAKDMYGLTGTDIFYDLNPYRNPANGFGNASFSYFFKQPCSKDDTLHTNIGNEKIYLTENSGYQVNLKLLEDNPHTTAVLLAMTHPEGGMVSWDSFKLANNPKPKPKTMTKQTLTKCHFDAYGGGVNRDVMERYQAIVSIEDRIKLGYVPDSTHPDIKSLLIAISKNKSLYDQDGFKSYWDDRVIEIFNKYIIAPPSGSLVLWKSGIIHYEAEFKRSSNDLYQFASMKNLPDQKRIRCIVGLHKPINMTQSELIEYARLAEAGLIPDMYQNINRDTRVHPNIMCGKSTQYKVYRKIPDEKRIELNNIISKKDLVIFDKMTNLKKHMYGITQSIEDLEISDVDKEMILDSIPCTKKVVKIVKSNTNSARTTATKVATKTVTKIIASRNGKKRKAVARRAN